MLEIIFRNLIHFDIEQLFLQVSNHTMNDDILQDKATEILKTCPLLYAL
jgi:hypothetical protein